MKNKAEIVVDALEKTGVRYLFGYPGGQNARFIEAVHGSGVEFVLVTHEASAGFMADVTARLTGNVGACLSTLGPGATNMTTGVGECLPGQGSPPGLHSTNGAILERPDRADAY